MIEENKTVEYFNKHTPSYHPIRYRYVVDFIKSHATPESTLLDIGCGTGNTLKHIKNETVIENVCGMDPAPNYIEITKNNVRCETITGSILDKSCIESISSEFDFIIMGTVLHHLVGKSRKQSMEYAKLAIENCLEILKKSGYLIIFEQAYYPAFAMSILFYVKQFVTKFFSGRFPIIFRGSNIGAPVVSYYTNEILYSMIDSFDEYKVVMQNTERKMPNILIRALGLKGFHTTIVGQKV